MMRTTVLPLGLIVGVGVLMSTNAIRAQLLITGNDEKVSFDPNTGKTITHPPGKDTVSIIDIADPTTPRIVANLPLMNTITGPPVNLAITPDQHLALVVNSLDWVKADDGWKGVPDNKIYVISNWDGRTLRAIFPGREIGSNLYPRAGVQRTDVCGILP